VDAPGRPPAGWMAKVWFPPSPVPVLQAKFPGAKVQFDSGANLESAATLAKNSDIAIVFAYQWESEGMDLESLSLPVKQDDIIAAVAAANPKTIVVLETGTAVTMPWLDKVARFWRRGTRGAGAQRRSSIFGWRRESQREAADDFPQERGGFASSESDEARSGADGGSGSDENRRGSADVYGAV